MKIMEFPSYSMLTVVFLLTFFIFPYLSFASGAFCSYVLPRFLLFTQATQFSYLTVLNHIVEAELRHGEGPIHSLLMEGIQAIYHGMALRTCAKCFTNFSLNTPYIPSSF